MNNKGFLGALSLGTGGVFLIVVVLSIIVLGFLSAFIGDFLLLVAGLGLFIVSLFVTEKDFYSKTVDGVKTKITVNALGMTVGGFMVLLSLFGKSIGDFLGFIGLSAISLNPSSAVSINGLMSAVNVNSSTVMDFNSFLFFLVLLVLVYWVSEWVILKNKPIKRRNR